MAFTIKTKQKNNTTKKFQVNMTVYLLDKRYYNVPVVYSIVQASIFCKNMFLDWIFDFSARHPESNLLCIEFEFISGTIYYNKVVESAFIDVPVPTAAQVDFQISLK
jgi:hypothetical protein